MFEVNDKVIAAKKIRDNAGVVIFRPGDTVGTIADVLAAGYYRVETLRGEVDIRGSHLKI
jgi:hypothetical protein